MYNSITTVLFLSALVTICISPFVKLVIAFVQSIFILQSHLCVKVVISVYLIDLLQLL